MHNPPPLAALRCISPCALKSLEKPSWKTADNEQEFQPLAATAIRPNLAKPIIFRNPKQFAWIQDPFFTSSYVRISPPREKMSRRLLSQKICSNVAFVRGADVLVAIRTVTAERRKARGESCWRHWRRPNTARRLRSPLVVASPQAKPSPFKPLFGWSAHAVATSGRGALLSW